MNLLYFTCSPSWTYPPQPACVLGYNSLIHQVIGYQKTSTNKTNKISVFLGKDGIHYIQQERHTLKRTYV
jgi:hypothetical protein